MLLELETERLFLRQWQQSDYLPFAQLNADPMVMEYFPSILSASESNAMADKCTALIAEKGWGFWALELKSSGQFIGFTGLHTPMTELPFAPCVEIGWRLAYEFWGRGYVTEAAKAALEVAFEHLKLNEVVAFTAVQNQKSQAVMKRLAMEYRGEFDHPILPIASPLRKHYWYSLLRENWLRVNPK